MDSSEPTAFNYPINRAARILSYGTMRARNRLLAKPTDQIKERETAEGAACSHI